MSQCVDKLYTTLIMIKNLVLTCSVVACNAIFLIWIAWIWITSDQIPNLIAPSSGLKFDYIIVGSGTAGSVLANRLSTNSNISVLLVEAGHTFAPYLKVPLLATFAQNSANDWSFLSTRQKYSSRGLINRVQCLPRGRGLGGSSQINYLLHYDGNPQDFDNWSQNWGAKGWDYEEMKKYLIKTKIKCNSCSNCHTNHSDLSEFCYRSLENLTNYNENIWKVPKNYSLLTKSLTKLENEFPSEEFYFELSKYNVKNGIRWSVYEIFLRPSFGRNNLKILLNTLVKKIVFKNKQAKSLIALTDNNEFKITANKEIILSAGAIQTPHILQLSGIGSKNHLKSIGIGRPIFESPMVGQNLFDHFNLPLFVSINDSASMTIDKLLSPLEVLQYLTTGKGYFSNFGVVGSIRDKNENFGISIFGTGSIEETTFMSLANFKREIFRELFPMHHNFSQEGFVLLSTCYQPKSRGTVFAKSSNINDNPEIDMNYLHNKLDISCTIKAVRLIVKVITSKSLSKLNPKIHWPKISRCSVFGPKKRDFITNQPSFYYLECIIRTLALASHHHGGTCAMGNNPNSVLDHRLRVRGVDGLRVVDASILPTPISGTPNSVLIGVAKKAADLILKDY